MKILRPIHLLLLCAAFVTSSSFASFSQARAMGGEAITICSPSGTHEIIIGANGEPVPAGHDCFECCISLNSAIEHDGFQLISSTIPERQAFVTEQSQWVSSGFANFRVRGPPTIV